MHHPGDCVSVDILVSATPGLIAQMRGFLTRLRYKYACVFMDHFSDFSYVHLMKDQSADSALEAKEAFEAYAESHGVDVKHTIMPTTVFSLHNCGRTHARSTIRALHLLE